MYKTKSLDDLHPHRNHELEHVRHQKAKRSELLTGIIDVKLREIGKLDSKKDILQECQNWVLDKVLYYMNLIDEVEVRHYMQVEELMGKFSIKDVAIQQQMKKIRDMEDEMRSMQRTIEGLRGQNRVLQQKLQREYQLKEEDTKKYVSINKLENLNRQLQSQVQFMQRENSELQYSLSLAKESILDGKGEIGMLQNQALRLKAKLQEQTKKGVNVTQVNQFKIHYAMSVCIRPPQRQAKKLSGRFMRQIMIEGLIVRSRAPSSGGLKDEEPIFINRLPSYAETGTQTSPPYLWKVKLNSVTLMGNPKQMKEITRNLLRKPQPDVKQTVVQDGRSSERFKEYYKRQLLSLQKEVKTLVQELNKINNKKVELVMEDKRELEALLDSHPSREQDIQHIHELITANKELVELSTEANSKAQKAYEAMRQCKTELDRYKSSTPMQIRPRLRMKSNPQTLTPCITSFTNRMNARGKKNRNRCSDEDVLITSILRNSLGSVEFSAGRQGRRFNSPISSHRDEYRETHRSVL